MATFLDMIRAAGGMGGQLSPSMPALNGGAGFGYTGTPMPMPWPPQTGAPGGGQGSFTTPIGQPGMMAPGMPGRGITGVGGYRGMPMPDYATQPGFLSLMEAMRQRAIPRVPDRALSQPYTGWLNEQRRRPQGPAGGTQQQQHQWWLDQQRQQSPVGQSQQAQHQWWLDQQRRRGRAVGGARSGPYTPQY